MSSMNSRMLYLSLLTFSFQEVILEMNILPSSRKYYLQLSAVTFFYYCTKTIGTSMWFCARAPPKALEESRGGTTADLSHPSCICPYYCGSIPVHLSYVCHKMCTCTNVMIHLQSTFLCEREKFACGGSKIRWKTKSFRGGVYTFMW